MVTPPPSLSGALLSLHMLCKLPGVKRLIFPFENWPCGHSRQFYWCLGAVGKGKRAVRHPWDRWSFETLQAFPFTQPRSSLLPSGEQGSAVGLAGLSQRLVFMLLFLIALHSSSETLMLSQNTKNYQSLQKSCFPPAPLTHG